MSKIKQPKKPKQIRKKRKWDDKYVAMAEVACARGGFKDEDLAALFAVNIRTIDNWKNEHHEFLEALKRGKDVFDTECVETALLKAAKGFSYTEVTKELRQGGGSEVEQSKSNLVITKEVTKEVVPNSACIIFWLKNRQPDRWKDKQDFDMGKESIETIIKALERRDELRASG